MSDERQEPPAGGHDDRTRPLPPTGDAAEPADRTQRLPRPEDRPAGPPGDETRPMPADRTAPMDRTAPLPPAGGPPAWSGRAEVPPPRPSEYRETTEWYAEEPGGRRWWSPILWGVLILLLLAALGVGLWLALNAGDDDEPTGPEPTPSVSVTRASPTTGAPTTSAAPTSASPSPTDEEGEVPVPPVVNLPLATAQAILDRAGLGYRIEYRTSDRPAGTVLDTDPEAGELVPEGEEVTLVVSRPEPSPEEPTVTPSPDPTPTD